MHTTCIYVQILSIEDVKICNIKQQEQEYKKSEKYANKLEIKTYGNGNPESWKSRVSYILKNENKF